MGGEQEREMGKEELEKRIKIHFDPSFLFPDHPPNEGDILWN